MPILEKDLIPMCKSSGCEKEAIAICHWPGQETLMCEEHCRGANNISLVMGAGRVMFTSLETGQTMVFQRQEAPA